MAAETGVVGLSAPSRRVQLMFAARLVSAAGTVGAIASAFTSGSLTLLEGLAILAGLIVVATAFAGTFRSQVAKIWREQAEGEKARVEMLTQRLAEARSESDRQIAQLREEALQQRELKHEALTELEAAKMRTDLTPILSLLAEQHRENKSLLEQLIQQGDK